MRIKTFLFILGLIALLDPKPLVSENNGNEQVMLTAIMYHSILKDPSRTGEYVVTPSQFENDLIYLSEKGYKAVTPKDIRDFCRGEGKLPEKPVLITFDDGHLNNMTYGLPLLEKYDMTAVINTVGAFSVQAEKENDPNPAYAYLTRENVRELEKSGRFFAGCHSFNMHSLNGRDGASKKPSESAEDYRKALSDDIDRWKEIFGSGHGVYAFPYGMMSEESVDILREKGFDIALTCREKKNYLNAGDDREVIVIDRFNRSGLMTTEEFMSENNI